jgi:hypothetical protein
MMAAPASARRKRRKIKKSRVSHVINQNFPLNYLVTKNSCTCPTLGELTKMIADEIKLEMGRRDARVLFMVRRQERRVEHHEEKKSHMRGMGEKRNGKIN